MSNVNLKTYIYAIGAVAVIIAILINVTGPSKYGSIRKDGKFYLNIDQIAADYNLDLSQNLEIDSDYINGVDNNLTEDLTKSLLLTNIFLEESGLTDSTVRGKILADIILNYQKQAKGKVYTDDDLNIIRNNDKNSKQEYFTDINRALNNYKASIKNLNMFDVSEYINNVTDANIINAKASITANILRLIEVNTSFINDLISIPATVDGAVYQLQLINIIYQQNVYLKSLMYIDTDPAKYILNNGDIFEQKFDSNISSIMDSFNKYFMNNNL